MRKEIINLVGCVDKMRFVTFSMFSKSRTFGWQKAENVRST